MNIVWITSEAFPYAKTGGLADVSSSLPKALAASGHQVDVIMPCYPQVLKDLYSDLKVNLPKIGVPGAFGKTRWGRVLTDEVNKNLRFHFIEYNNYYDRPTLYDWQGEEYKDNCERFIFLTRAALQYVIDKDLSPDILHCNDWHTALAPVFLNSAMYRNCDNFTNTKCVLTIHNIGYQGIFPKSKFDQTGLSWDHFDSSCLEFHDQINFLKAGIMCADRVNTVSPTYAAEIMTPEYSFSLEGPLHHIDYLGKLSGILNGIDTQEWNPITDKLLPYNYSANHLHGKEKCKEELQKHFNLPLSKSTPIIGVVSRFAHQKGLDVFAYCIDDILKYDDVQIVILGSGDSSLETRFRFLANSYPSKIAINVGYSEKISHLIEAGSDMFMMPSRYEPCGLNQMYSMLYGSVPIVRGTGGLADTVINLTNENANDATGFKFYEMSGNALGRTIKWALDIYHNQPVTFNLMRRNGMLKDFSWQKTASAYERLYEEII